MPNSRWTASNPPPGWPLPPAVINLVPGASFPANFTYLNFGKQTQKGFELGVNSTLNRYVGDVRELLVPGGARWRTSR